MTFHKVHIIIFFIFFRLSDNPAQISNCLRTYHRAWNFLSIIRGGRKEIDGGSPGGEGGGMSSRVVSRTSQRVYRISRYFQNFSDKFTEISDHSRSFHRVQAFLVTSGDSNLWLHCSITGGHTRADLIGWIIDRDCFYHTVNHIRLIYCGIN